MTDQITRPFGFSLLIACVLSLLLTLVQNGAMVTHVRYFPVMDATRSLVDVILDGLLFTEVVPDHLACVLYNPKDDNTLLSLSFVSS